MDELEEIRKKRLEELQARHIEQLRSQQQEEEQLQQQLLMIESFVRQRLTKEAVERYGNIKAAHPEKAVQLLTILAQAIETQGIEKIDDNQLREILKRMTPRKGPTTIKTHNGF